MFIIRSPRAGGYPQWCYQGADGWGVCDSVDKALGFPNAFRAMRWYLRKHAQPRAYLYCFQQGIWTVAPREAERPLEAHTEIDANLFGDRAMIDRAHRRMMQATAAPAAPAPRIMPAKAGTLFGPPELVQGKLFAAPAPLEPQPYIAPAELAARLANRPGSPQKASGRIAKAWQRRTAEDERIARQYDAEQTPRLF